METSTPNKLSSIFCQSSYHYNINYSKTKLKNYKQIQDHQEPCINIGQRYRFKSDFNKIQSILENSKIKMLRDYLMKNEFVDKNIIMMILYDKYETQDKQISKQKLHLSQLSYKVKCLIQQNIRLRDRSGQQQIKVDFINSINKLNLSNINKLQQQEKIIIKLESRLNQLSEIWEYLKKFQFQKRVHLQETFTKSKIQITKCPAAIGESSFKSNQQNPIVELQSYSHDFINKDKYIGEVVLKNLQRKNEQLEQQLQIIRQKWELQIQNKIKQIGQKEELIINLQKVKAQRKQLQYAFNKINEQLAQSTIKIKQYEDHLSQQQQKIKSNSKISNEVISQLKQIKNSLIKCNKSNINSLEAQIIELTEERNQFRRQYLKLKNKANYTEPKNEIKFLQEKNLELEEKCSFYLKQIEKYEKKLKQISQQKQKNIVQHIMNDFKEMNNPQKYSMGLKWSRATHNCIMNIINRLENLQINLMNSKTYI